MDAKTTGRFIAELRRQKGYAQKELAETLMVTDQAISRWETGKGFPDTALLKPLGDALSVSVGELLAGQRIEETDMKEQTDRVILDALHYTGRMLADVVSVIVFLAALALLLSPLFVTGQSPVWVLGLFLAAALLSACIKRRRGAPPIAREAYYLAALVLQGVALILEILPLGAVMVFATGSNAYTVETYSYFSLLPVGYANVTPMLTGVLTVAVLLLGVIALFRFDRRVKCRNAAFICSVLALLFSLILRLLFGAVGMTAASYGVSGAILLSVCLQALANRQG